MKNKKFSLLKSARMSKNNSEDCEGTMGILKNIFISLRKLFLNLSLKLIENHVVISDQGLCEDFLRRASYIIQFLKEQCNVECKLCHKNVDKGEEVQ